MEGRSKFITASRLFVGVKPWSAPIILSRAGAITSRSPEQIIIKTIDNRKIIRNLAYLLVLVCSGFVILVNVNVVDPGGIILMLGKFLRQLTPSGVEIFLNIANFTPAFILSGLVLYFYPQCHHKFADLLCAVILIFFASFLFGLYSGLSEVFHIMKGDGLRSEEEAVRIHLIEDLRVLVLVVPAVMLGVAANLITQFLNASRDNDKMRVLLERNRSENRYKTR